MDSETKPLWPNGHKLGLISVSGEHESGKSLFGLMVCPESTCVIDTERSVESYESAFQMKRVRKLDEITTVAGNAVIDLNVITNLKADGVARKRAFEAVVDKIPAGRWRVIVVDVLTDIEDAFADYVEVNAAEFGGTHGQFAKMSGLKWKAVKRLEKTVLLKLMEKCECVVIARHMRDKWENGVRRNEREAKGLDSIDELSSLSVELRRPVAKDGSKPAVPSALMVKTRMTHVALVDGELKVFPLFPPRFDKFSPADVRNYILNPANYDKLKKSEKAEKEELSDDQKLLIQSQIAADQRAAAEAAQANGQPLPPLPEPNLTGKPGGAAVVEKPSSAKPKAAPKQSPYVEPLLEEIGRLKTALEIDDAKWQEILEMLDAPMDTEHVRRISLGTADQQQQLATWLSNQIDERARAAKQSDSAEFVSTGETSSKN